MDSAVDDTRLEMLALSAELCRIYAQDDSETANIAAIDAVRRSFHADAAALFYVNGKKEYKICLAGTRFPISLPEGRWTACVATHTGESAVARFGSWALPGIEKPLPFWMSVRLYVADAEGGYVFLGRENGIWRESDMTILATIRDTIAPIVEIRYERDVEEQKRKVAESLLAKNESRLRDLFEGSRDMIYTATAGDLITSVNMAGPGLLGYPSKADLVGKPFSAFIMNAGDRLPFLQKIVEAGYVDDYEIVLTKADGTAIFCLETAHALRNAAGEILEVLGIVKDISERIRSERELWKMNLELAETNLKLQKTQGVMVQHEKLASIGQLAAGIAHEINNPLGFLISNNVTLRRYFGRMRAAWTDASSACGPVVTEFAKQKNIDALFAESETIFAEADDGFNRISKIVSNLKSFSRIDQSGDFASFDVNAGVEGTLVVAGNEIKYVAEVRKNLGPVPHIRANGSEINQVLLNIIVNAAQALGSVPRSKKGVIEIATRVEGKNVIITIGDNGPGIPKDIENRIFDPFFTTKEPGKGTGLGLSISYDIVVNKHGGSLWAESEPGVGTTFFIALPVAGPDPGKAAPDGSVVAVP